MSLTNLTLPLEARTIAPCPNPDLPPHLLRAFGTGVLQHQAAVYRAAADHDIVLDLAPTGTGKTKAGLSVLDYNRDRNAIYIAPTNALIEQQTAAAQAFVTAAGWSHLVKAASAETVKTWVCHTQTKRSGEKLYNALREPANVFPDCRGGQPVLLVTNPDIFYYATFFAYGRLDRTNIASEFYSGFSTLIFDEFHLYNAKQLVSLLFYLALSQVFGYFDHNRKVVLLTATPERACTAALEVLSQAGVRIQQVTGEEAGGDPLPSQTAVTLTLQPMVAKDALITAISQEVIDRLRHQPHQQGAVILDGKDTLNRVWDQLEKKGYGAVCGRITGNTPICDRHTAAQKQVILATSTVDVGFNFERDIAPDRQNLDWLIYSARDRFSFWQRLGRVGRVLGKKITTIPSTATAYLPEAAWDQGLGQESIAGGRVALTQALEQLPCLDRPFLEIYWRSEAFLEVAKPLLELESKLENLPQADLILKLYQILQTLFGGKRNWQFYRTRMKQIQGAEQIANADCTTIKTKWRYLAGGQNFVMSYIKTYCPESYQEHGSDDFLDQIAEAIKTDPNLVHNLKEYAKILQASYAPLFQFRDSLFENLKIEDPRKLLLDAGGQTLLDPIHLLRFYEFIADGDVSILTSRAEQSYQLSFSHRVKDGTLEDFESECLCRLYAFDQVSIRRTIDGIPRPTPLIQQLQKELMAGLVVKENMNSRWAICKLQKQGLSCYDLAVEGCDGSQGYYKFFPSLSGILALATAGFAFQAPDREEFWVI